MPRDTRRADRVAEGIREEIALILATGVKDPRITGFVTVTGVDVTSDLRHARVHVTVMGDEAATASTMEALGHLGRRVRGSIGRALRLRLAPEIEFRKDETIARASRIEALLAQVRESPKASPSPDADPDTPDASS
jgi:ribosome-binding factor A